VRQIECEVVDLLLDAANDGQCFAEVGLCMTRRMHQRHEHLSRALLATGHVVLHDGDATGKPMLVAQPLENPLRGVLLLLRAGFVVGEDLVDDRNERVELWPHRRLGADVTGRYRERHHLVDGSGIKPEPARRRPLADPLDLYRVTNLQIVVHVEHPPPSAERGTGLTTAGVLLRRNRTIRLPQ
jgi:hypothetical protein